MSVDVIAIDNKAFIAHFDNVYDIEYKAADSTHSYPRYVFYCFGNGSFSTLSVRAEGSYLMVV